MSTKTPWVFLFLLFLLLLPLAATAQAPGEARVVATGRALDEPTEELLRGYVATELAPAWVAAVGGSAAVQKYLRAIALAVGPLDVVGILSGGEEWSYELHIENRQYRSLVAVELSPERPHRITRVELLRQEDARAFGGLSWENLEERLEEARASGFHGSVLAVLDGEVMLERGYGHADPAGEHPVTPNTLFAIGSTPIDFTHGSILLLAQRGEVSLDDTLGAYFPRAPAEKAAITLEQLRTGRSGLLDFPGIAGVDENLDLSWIDREEFLRRIWASDLLFEPGAQERHSHAAWGVLAAVVEEVSGRGYEEFLRVEFFEPAGMERTGHYPLAQRFPPPEVAVGLVGNKWGEPNSPVAWGETSWLVMGRGGMVSTPRDLWRWRRFLGSGEILQPGWQRRYGIGGTEANESSNDRGFLNVIGVHGDDMVVLCSNHHEIGEDLAHKLARALVGMVLRE